MPNVNLNISRKLFNDIYYPYLTDYSHRYEVYYGGAGSGKSVFIAQKLVVKALRQKRKILVVRKVMGTQKDSCWQLILDTLTRFKIMDYCSTNKTNFIIELPNGSQFLFKGLDNQEKIKSIVGITDIWCEEASEFVVEDIEQLDLRLRANANNLQMIFSFNPISKINWTYKRWFEKPCEDENTLIVKSTYLDNRFLPKEYIDALERMKETNYTYWQIYANGEFSSLDKLIFTNWEVYQDGATPTNLPLLVGLDFGYINDPSAMIVARIDEDNKIIYVIDEMYERGLLNNEIAERIIYKGLAKEVIIADSAEQKSIEEIRRLGVPRIKPAAKGQGSILQGIQKLQQYKLLVSPTCRNFIIELQNYSWEKDKSGEYVNKPQDSFNHCCDALRYSLQCLDNKQKLQTISKAALGL